jgi:hypothetical protein
VNPNTLVIAVATVLAGVAAPASAAFFYSIGNTAVVKISGSSATNTQLKLWAQSVLCDSTNQVTWTNDSDNFAVVCMPKPGKISLSSGKINIAVVKTSVGGSVLGGIYPLIYQSTLPMLNVFECGGSGGPAPASGPSATTCNSRYYLSDIGVSDEEPAVLVAAGAAFGDISKLDSTPLNVESFGTPVTLGLYHALQDAQIASGRLSSDCKGTPGSNNPRDAQGYSVSEACMPSLSKAHLASIFSGNAVDWSEFGLNNPSDDNNIYVARHVNSSGTQIAARVFFLNDPCAASVGQFLSGNDGQGYTRADACNAATPAGTVFEGYGPGNVATCLTNHERNSRWAIGINPLEFPAVINDQSSEYAIGGGAATGVKIANKNYQRHIKIDGVSPSTFNVAVNRYRNWVEATMNTSNVYALSTDAFALQRAMWSTFNDPAVLRTLNNGYSTTALWHVAGETTLDVGILAPAQMVDPVYPPAFPATEAATHTAPKMYYAHSIFGTPNTCQPAMSYYADGLNP